jgi:histidinol-phosphatase
MNADWRTRYDIAVEAAQKAGQIALAWYPDEGLAEFQKKVEWKADCSPVTIADKSAEAYLRTTLLGAFPQDGFLGEESGDQVGSSGYRWIIDPVDGTRSFVRGIPLWATLVGLEYKGEPIAGVACLPVLGHTYRALRGDGAYRGDRKIAVSDIAMMDQAIMFYSSISWFLKAGRHEDFLDLARRTQRQRGFGDFYGFVLVAQGSGELMVEHGVHVWDVAGLLPLIEEAGGRFTDWEGNRTVYRADVIASNGRLHDEALAVLRGKHGKP